MPSKSKGKSSMDYYRDNPESYRKKLASQKEINKRPEERKNFQRFCGAGIYKYFKRL